MPNPVPTGVEAPEERVSEFMLPWSLPMPPPPGLVEVTVDLEMLKIRFPPLKRRRAEKAEFMDPILDSETAIEAGRWRVPLLR